MRVFVDITFFEKSSCAGIFTTARMHIVRWQFLYEVRFQKIHVFKITGDFV